ncbi:CWF19-like protein 2 isoform X2 [Tripterygium wilfordii]|uniref:CWF19-like protein 2 isoform X2 n=1 Tax=Tripterygium wilfordii TaxID=458696 RepID=UPI0018F7F384|nr:CWF19-like protein 2 isoform X2 [Tripterygium wilfordii]
MLSGIKFIPREEFEKVQDDKGKKSGNKVYGKGKDGRRSRKKSYSSSDDELKKIKRRSRKSKKWSSSEEDISPSESDYSSDRDEKRNRNRIRKKNKRRSDDCLGDSKGSKRRSNGSEKHYSSEYSLSTSEDEHQGGSRQDRKKRESLVGDLSDDGRRTNSVKETEIVRKEMGLEWMLRPGERIGGKPKEVVDKEPEEPATEEIKRVNPKELNPYLKDDGSGYPEDADDRKAGGDKLLTSSVVGDGGASWRLKALKRAQEQAAREGRNLSDVVGERWSSLGELTVSAASHIAAPSRAHLHAIKNRKKGLTEEHQSGTDNETKKVMEKSIGRDYLKDVSVRHPKMKAPKVHGSLSWGKRKAQNLSMEDAAVITAATASLNKFSNDGSFMSEVLSQSTNLGGSGGTSSNHEGKSEPQLPSEGSVVVKEVLSANQLAAKALQLRMKGKYEEAEKLLQEGENMKVNHSALDGGATRPQKSENISRYIITDLSTRKEEDADRHLAHKIMQNKQYSLSGRADDEYDFEDGPKKKSRKKGGDDDHKVSGKNSFAKRILTQQERCIFCFENPSRPKHLVVSIANFSYLMLPKYQPLVPGHCCILTLQHESATRTVDDNVWGEIRNFKKCLIMMFAKQEKDLVFIETVMGLAQQRRHCMIECIPVPREIAKQAPLYFKKAIDEAEDEWSQHDAKKLIDTSVKGLRGSIPKNFPYFHVEFGLHKGFVHVIDDETNFKSSLGLNVIRGMLQLPEEDMYRRRQHETIEAQKQAVAKFAQEWEPFDWTKQLD